MYSAYVPACARHFLRVCQARPYGGWQRLLACVGSSPCVSRFPHILLLLLYYRYIPHLLDRPSGRCWLTFYCTTSVSPMPLLTSYYLEGGLYYDMGAI